MPLFSREMLLRKVKEGRAAKVLGTAAAGSGLAAAVLMASSPDAVLKKDDDLKSGANLRQATHKATGNMSITVPERGRVKHTKYVRSYLVGRDNKDDSVRAGIHMVLLPQGKHELSGVLDEYRTDRIQMETLLPAAVAGAGLMGRNRLLAGVGGALLAGASALTAARASRFGKIKRELEKDPNLSDAEREYLKRQQRRNLLIPALTAAAGLMGGAGLRTAIGG